MLTNFCRLLPCLLSDLRALLSDTSSGGRIALRGAGRRRSCARHLGRCLSDLRRLLARLLGRFCTLLSDIHSLLT
ncbi:Uncharacterised protein [Mycobacteroides abscessus subsp. abscessus]|nr:Uncharacterised protein [Mycobacteroides abscessus subsp. abscessus]